MLQWQHLFSRTIMSRGKEYYHNNAVKDLRQWAGTYRASVAGREKYDVHLPLCRGRQPLQTHGGCSVCDIRGGAERRG